MKSTYGEIYGEPQVIFKQPKTGDGMKNSAVGLLKVERIDGTFVLRENVSEPEEKEGALKIVFEDGKFYERINFAQVRNNALRKK